MLFKVTFDGRYSININKRERKLDKSEYRSKLEEINTLAEEGKFHEAASVSDGVDWRHVKSARTLCMIGEIYEADKRYEDSVRVLKYAYRRSSTSKTVLYRLAELEIRVRDYDAAKKYMEEFERNSPGDMSRYILRYKLLRAQKAPLDDQIGVLREYKDNEYTERWAYELAKLYRRNGQKEKCIEECDDMILWFAEGKYVTKALELKKSLTDLTPSQQAKYDAIVSERERKEAEAEAAESGSNDEAEASLDAIETVEKTILASDEEDDDVHTDIHADEAIAKLDSAAGRFSTKQESETAGHEDGAKAASVPERITDRISHGFRSILSSIKLESDEGDQEAEKKGQRASGTGSESAESDDDLADAFSYAKEVVRARNESAPAERKNVASDISKEKDNKEESSKEESSKEENNKEDNKEESSKKENNKEENYKGETQKEEGTSAGVVDEAAVESFEETAVGTSDVVADQTAEKVADENADPEGSGIEDEHAKTDASVDTFDFEALFAETGSVLAGEVASGEYTLTDSLKNDPETGSDDVQSVAAALDENSVKIGDAAIEELNIGEAAGKADAEKDEKTESAAVKAEEASAEVEKVSSEVKEVYGAIEKVPSKAEEASAEADEVPSEAEEVSAETEEVPSETEEVSAEEETSDHLTARETDESLGLTREFHFKEELAKASAAKENGMADAEPNPVEDPEEAAKRTVLEANGKTYESQSVDETEDSDMKIAEDRGAADEDLLAAFSDDAGQDEEELPMDEQVEEDAASEFREEQKASDDAVEALASGPDTYLTIPVEGRAFTEEEKKIMSYFASIPGIDMQTTAAIADIHNNSGDKTSKSGNIVLMGRPGSGKTRLADGIVLIAARDLGLSAVRVGKIVADDFNTKDPAAIVRKLSGGFLVIEGAGALSDEAVKQLDQAMEFRTDDLVVILEDEKADVSALLEKHPDFAKKFTSRITVPVFTNDELVSFGKTYAYEEGYKLDDMATLALYTMIGDNQKASEPVTVARVREMLDKAISKSNRRLFGKTTDKSDGRTILQEKDFAF